MGRESACLPEWFGTISSPMRTLHFISNICHLITGDTAPPPLEMSGQKAEAHLTVRYLSLREGNGLPRTAAGHGKGISGSQSQLTPVALGPRKASYWFPFLPSRGLTHLGLLPSSATRCCVTSGGGLTSLFLGLPPKVSWRSEFFGQLEGTRVVLEAPPVPAWLPLPQVPLCPMS